MTVHLHEGDLPADLRFGASVAVDTETMSSKPPVRRPVAMAKPSPSKASMTCACLRLVTGTKRAMRATEQRAREAYVEKFGLEPDRFDQLVEPRAGLGR